MIGLGHHGYDNDVDMAALVDLDVIIGGHSHSLLATDYDLLADGDEKKVKGKYPTVKTNSVGNTVLVGQSFRHGKYLGNIQANFTKTGASSWRIEHFTGEPLLLDSSIPEKTEIKEELLKWKRTVDELTKEKVGETEVDLEGDRSIVRRKESNLGNLVADAAAKSNGVRLAFVNGGGIRSSIPVGEVRTVPLKLIELD